MKQPNDYGEIWRDVKQKVESSAVEVAWRQWAALGAPARATSYPSKLRIIDPEALILLSAAFRSEERRLTEMLEWWANTGTPLTSLHRMKSVVDQSAGKSEEYLSVFAGLAVASGYRNWRRYSLSSNVSTTAGRSPVSSKLRLATPATLMLRLRASFGVGAKSDILTFLIGDRTMSSTVASITRAVGYTTTAVREALKDMVIAGIVAETSDHPACYSTSRRAWNELLGLTRNGESDGAIWCMWVPVFDFLIRARNLAESALADGYSDYVAASMAGDILAASSAFHYHGIRVPNISQYPGRELGRALLITAESVGSWIDRSD